MTCDLPNHVRHVECLLPLCLKAQVPDAVAHPLLCCRPALTECMLISFFCKGVRQSLHVLRERGADCLAGAFMVTELNKLPFPRSEPFPNPKLNGAVHSCPLFSVALGLPALTALRIRILQLCCLCSVIPWAVQGQCYN